MRFVAPCCAEPNGLLLVEIPPLRGCTPGGRRVGNIHVQALALVSVEHGQIGGDSGGVDPLNRLAGMVAPVRSLVVALTLFWYAKRRPTGAPRASVLLKK